MIEMDRINEMLDEIADTLPQEIYKELNGGIVLNPNIKHHPEARADDLYILGEYNHSNAMGRYIVIYGGSFQQLYGNSSEKAMKRELEKTLKHEFTHHIESLMGEKDLEVEDEIKMRRYREGR